MHINHSNQQGVYQLNGNRLEKFTQEKDLRVVVTDNLKFTAHVATVAAWANSKLGKMKRNFSVLTKDIMLPLYLSLVLPILDYGTQCWSPYLRQEIQVLKRVQSRATKLIPDLV